MIINKVTISGADDRVNIENMISIQKQYPFVEWGILISYQRSGSNRYPSASWIDKLPYELDISLHLCGAVCRSFLANPNMESIEAINGDHWSRVQLNLSLKDKDYFQELELVVRFAEKTSKGIILPYNKGNQPNIDKILSRGELPENIHFLYDSSGGRGTEIKSFNKPLPTYTGYAGGLSPDNVFDTCDLLTNMYEWEDNIWIDMETGVRTDDKFDLDKVRSVLSKSQNFINQPMP